MNMKNYNVEQHLNIVVQRQIQIVSIIPMFINNHLLYITYVIHPHLIRRSDRSNRIHRNVVISVSHCIRCKIYTSIDTEKEKEQIYACACFYSRTHPSILNAIVYVKENLHSESSGGCGHRHH